VPRDVLGDLAGLGPFFAVDAHPAGAEPAPPWRPGRELAEPSGPLLARIESVRAALAERGGCPPGDIELRVAASVMHLGLTARLVSPALAALAGRGRLDLRLDGLWWQDTAGGPVPLSVPDPGGAERSGAGPADDCRRLLDEVIAPVTEAVSGLVPVSPRVLWGNVASAVNGAAGMVAAQRADLSEQAWAVAAAFFRSPRLGRERRPPGPSFRRSSCCLIYRLAPAGPRAVCGDCVLRGLGPGAAPVS
jgi:hypothetical protein